MIEIGKELKIVMEEDFNKVSINDRLELFTTKNDVLDINGGGYTDNNIDILQKKRSIKDSISSLMNISEKNKTRYPRMKSLSDTVNDLYSKIDTMLRNDIGGRKAHASDVVKGQYKYMQIYWPKKKKVFNFTYAKTFIDMEHVGNMIKREMSSMDPKKKDYRSLEAYKSYIYDDLHKKYWFVLETELIPKSSGDIKGYLEDHILTTKKNADSVYVTLYNITNINGIENKYVLLFKKQYDELEYVYGKDEKAMKIIDDIFAQCIKYTEASIKFNFESSLHLTSFMEHYVKQMEGFYQIIRS